MAHKRAVNRPRRLSDARHECAHGLMAEVLGMRVKRLELNPTEDTLGLCHLDKRFVLGPLRMGIVYAAGTAIDQHYGVLEPDDWAAGDLPLIEKFFVHRSDLDQLLVLTKFYVEQYLGPIETAAQELVKRDLTGREFRTILRSCG